MVESVIASHVRKSRKSFLKAPVPTLVRSAWSAKKEDISLRVLDEACSILLAAGIFVMVYFSGKGVWWP